MNEGNLIINVKADKSSMEKQTYLSNTLRTNLNYFGSKMINSVNNKYIIPEDSRKFSSKDIIYTSGIKSGLLINEIFINNEEVDIR